ncbi:MAG: aldose epimerase family protein [Bacteroidota bacterium]
MQNCSFLSLLVFVLFLVACGSDSTIKKEAAPPPDPQAGLAVTSSVFGQTPEGTAYLYTLSNKNGMKVAISNYGGIVQAIEVPDKDGNIADVVLGFDSLSGYLGSANPYFGGIIGRYGNRIAKGKFRLNGVDYKLVKNNDANHLHGGTKGFDKVLWQAKEMAGGDAKGVELTYTSKDMEEGYPGNLNVKVFYLLNNQNELLIRYEANTDKPTHCNLTNHTYFNLKGEGKGDILDHQIKINADWMTPVDKTLIPTGKLMPVKGTPFDFRVQKPVGKDIAVDHPQIKFGNGYDHNFVIGETDGRRVAVANVYEPTTGRFMEVLSEEPGVQFYTGNFLDGKIAGKNGHQYPFRSGFCLETQHYPDSPNQEKFPSTVLNPLEMYRTSTVYRFSVR